MNISSVSPSTQSSAPTSEKANGKGVASESVKSVTPELSSLGAVGGEGVSYVPDAKRDAVTVLSTEILEDLSLQEVKEITLFEKNDHCVVSLFNEKRLEEVVDEIHIVVRRLKEKKEV